MHAVQHIDFARMASDLSLSWRLAHIPANARMRGLFFNALRDQLERRNLTRVPELARFARVRRKTYGLYPVAEIVEACAYAGALVHPDPRKGMRELFNPNTRFVTSTWYGRVFTKYLTPYDALRWLERSREYVADYGGWRLEYRTEGFAIMHKCDEYFWLEALQGACEGMLAAFGVRGAVQVEEDSPFMGRLVIRWTPNVS